MPTLRNPTEGYEECALSIAPDRSLVAVGETVTSFPDRASRSANGSSAGFVARYTGFGRP